MPQKKRIGIVEYRNKGESELHARQFDSDAEMQAFVDQHRDRVALDTDGKIANIQRGNWDWFLQRWLTIDQEAQT